MKVLFILNHAPYGTEHCYNALRLAHALGKGDDTEIAIFLMADSVLFAKIGQKTPEGFYNIELMLKRGFSRQGKGVFLLCGTCMEARGMTDADLLHGSRRSTMDELAKLTADAGKVMIW